MKLFGAFVGACAYNIRVHTTSVYDPFFGDMDWYDDWLNTAYDWAELIGDYSSRGS